MAALLTVHFFDVENFQLIKFKMLTNGNFKKKWQMPLTNGHAILNFKIKGCLKFIFLMVGTNS